MKTALLLFGLFWIGFYAAELIGAISKKDAPLGANLLLAVSFACVGYYFV